MRSGYCNTNSKDGCFSPRLSAKLNARIDNYCMGRNLNKTKFVEDCVNVRLDALEREAYMDMSKEMLVEMLLSQKK